MAVLEHCFLDTIISVVAERDVSSCRVSVGVPGWVARGGIPRVTSRGTGGSREAMLLRKYLVVALQLVILPFSLFLL